MEAQSRVERGFILVPVLWVLALLAIVTAILTRTVTNDIKVSANLLHRSEQEELSDGVARLAIRYVLSNPVDADHIGAFKLDGTPETCLVGESIAAVSIASTAGQIGLNTASAELLEKLFEGAGAADPKSLAAAVVDFRDADDEALPGGAEAAEYAAAGREYEPKNGPFKIVDELDQVLGMTSEVFERVRPLVTTRSRLPSPDLAVASPALRALSLANDLANTSRVRNVQIRVSVHGLAASRTYTRETVILIEQRIQGGFALKNWIRSDQHLPTTGGLDASQLPSCITSLLATNS